MSVLKNYPWLDDVSVGDGVTLSFGYDAESYTVVSIQKNKVILQRDKATLLNGVDSGEPDALNADVGGFAAHFTGTQRWKYERDEFGSTHVLKKRKVRNKNEYRWNIGSASSVSIGRNEYYDFNF